jgi:hypothetical protein
MTNELSIMSLWAIAIQKLTLKFYIKNIPTLIICLKNISTLLAVLSVDIPRPTIAYTIHNTVMLHGYALNVYLRYTVNLYYSRLL